MNRRRGSISKDISSQRRRFSKGFPSFSKGSLRHSVEASQTSKPERMRLLQRPEVSSIMKAANPFRTAGVDIYNLAHPT